MKRGYPDWGYIPSSFGNFELDTSELAARLGSPYVLTRSGRVIFIEKFDCGLWTWNTNVPAGTLSLVTSLEKGFPSLGYLTAINTAAVIQASNIYKEFPIIRNTKLGVEFVIARKTANVNFVIELSVFLNNEFDTYKMKIDLQNKKLAVLLPDNTFQNVMDIAMPSGAEHIWQVGKMVVDLANFSYGLVQWNDNIVSSGLPLGKRLIAPQTSEYIAMFAIFDGYAAAAWEFYLTSVVLTIDET